MANKKFVPGMLVIALIFGMMVVGCNENPGEENSYKGDWTGTFKPKDGEEAEATISFTDDTWELKAGDITLSGTYTEGLLGTTELFVESSAGPFKVATGVIALNNLTITFTAGAYGGAKGSFTRVKVSSDSFKGTWTGTYTPTLGTARSATIKFDDDTWELTAGAIALNGSYTKSTLGLTASLKTTTDIGDVGIGEAILNPITKELTVIITLLGSNGKGAFKQ
jgi:hypothetical protein